jgi:hypothetical protein
MFFNFKATQCSIPPTKGDINRKMLKIITLRKKQRMRVLRPPRVLPTSNTTYHVARSDMLIY